MKPQNNTKGAAGQFWRLHLIAAMLLVFASSAFAASGKGKYGPHAAPDIDNFPVNAAIFTRNFPRGSPNGKTAGLSLANS